MKTNWNRKKIIPYDKMVGIEEWIGIVAEPKIFLLKLPELEAGYRKETKGRQGLEKRDESSVLNWKIILIDCSLL